MKSIFAKTLAAAAIAGVCSANAGTITAYTSDSAYSGGLWPLVSLEGVSLFDEPTLSIGMGDDYVPVTLTTAVDYALGTTITVTVSGATVSSDSVPSLNNDSVSYLGSSVEDDGTAFSFLVTDDDGLVSGTELVLSGVVLDLEDSPAVVQVSFEATELATNVVIDNAAATNVAQVGSELAVGVASTFASGDNEGVISVASNRTQFVDGSTADSFSLSVSAGADIFGVMPGAATVSVSGADLSFMVDSEGALTSDSYWLYTNGVAGAEDAELDEMATEFSARTAAYVTSTGGSDVTLRIGAVDGNELVAQSFTAGMDLEYSLGGTDGNFEVDGMEVGAWTLSGTTFNIPYMPYGSNISQVIYISNSSNIDGSIELTAFDDEGNTYGPVMLDAQARAGRVTSLASAVKTALEADDDFDGAGRFDISLTINGSEMDLDLFTAYNVGGNRVDTPNSVTGAE